MFMQFQNWKRFRHLINLGAKIILRDFLTLKHIIAVKITKTASAIGAQKTAAIEPLNLRKQGLYLYSLK